MVQLRMRATTFDVEHGGRLLAGQLVEVEDDVARRWRRNGLAGDPDDPEIKEKLGQSPEAMQAEIARLEEELAAAREGRTLGPRLPESQAPYGAESDLGGLDFLSEQQRVNLGRAGLGTLARIADADDDELAEVDRIGASTIVKLRAAAEAAASASAPSPLS